MDAHSLTALLATSETLERELVSLLIIGLVAASVPLVVGLLRLRVAEVVLLLGFGILLGPNVLGLIEIDESVQLMNELGLGLLFFLAGYELEQSTIRGRSGRLAASGWVVSLVIALVVVWGLWELGVVNDLVGIAIALTTTAMGTLLPVVRDRGQLSTPFGQFFMGGGAAGEFGPILAIALLLGSKSMWITILVLAVFAVLAYLVWRAPGHLMSTRVRELMDRSHHTSSQTAVRWTVVLLLFLLTIAASFGFDAVLGAFVAGVILRRYSPPDAGNRLLPKVEAIGFGFFIPLFFIVSGANLDIASIAKNPLRLLLFFALLLLVRGLPQYVLYRYALPDTRERWQFSLYIATGLPLLVAITTIQVGAGVMLPENAAALVGAGALSVLVFPLLGDRINPRRETAAQDEVEAEPAR
ncbi:cation:proton antiporter [Longivirga aurantiaca]|uniref:Cation:proton antiporter n=1 Tax=Longivirga aurantiaca TaxID=1837743 RepID=A0ABW1SVZ0_9ACTN